MKKSSLFFVVMTLFVTGAARAQSVAPVTYPVTYDCLDQTNHPIVLMLNDASNISFFIQKNPPAEKNLVGTATQLAGQDPSSLTSSYGNFQDWNGNDTTFPLLSEIRVVFRPDGSVKLVRLMDNSAVTDEFGRCTVDNGS